MDNQQHPIAPPPELAEEWICGKEGLDRVVTRAAQWGADQELEACCEWTTANFGELPGQNLYLFRRPKPPSLKDLALKALEEAEHADHPVQLTILNTAAHVLIREALESIPES